MSDKLKEAREAAGYTIEYVADKLNIRKQYLIALEDGDYHKLPGEAYVDGYIKIYYKFLGINLQKKLNNSNINVTKIENDIQVSSKYKKYIIFCSVIFFILVLISFNLLKFQN